VGDILSRDLPAQVGVTSRFLPFIREDDNKTLDGLVKYLVGVGPSPRHEYLVYEHLLICPSMPWDMTWFLDPLYVRVKDMGRLFRQRIPSTDKLFNLRYDPSLGLFFQHRHDNIRLTTKASNAGKHDSVTPLVADLLEYAIFLRQTASCQIGDTCASQRISVIYNLLNSAWETGESKVQTW